MYTFYYKYLKYKKKSIFNLGIKTFSQSVKRKSRTASLTAIGANKRRVLANEFHVRSILHGQVSLATVKQICEIHEAVNGCKNLKIH